MSSAMRPNQLFSIYERLEPEAQKVLLANLTPAARRELRLAERDEAVLACLKHYAGVAPTTAQAVLADRLDEYLSRDPNRPRATGALDLAIERLALLNGRRRLAKGHIYKIANGTRA